MSKLLDFYGSGFPDTEGRVIEQIWQYSDDELEEAHDFIQWLFPLIEPSHFNPEAPLLGDEEIAVFRSDERLRENLRKSFERLLQFFGLRLSPSGEVVEADNFQQRIPEIWAYRNHNWIRITRMLKSLSLLGLESEALAFFEKLNQLYGRRKFPIDDETFAYWEAAVKKD